MMKPNEPRICFWDLETSNLNADFGFIITAAWKFKGEKVHSVAISDFKQFRHDVVDDREVAKAMYEALAGADIEVSWFGTYFDIPFLNTRLLKHGLTPLPPVSHIDGWRVARNQLKLHSNRLDSVSKFLGIEEKTPIKGEYWVRAAAGDKRAIEYVREHNEQDVIVLEQAYDRLLPYISQHPNMAAIKGNIGGCKNCGVLGSFEKRGWSYTACYKKQRICCKNCGRWDFGELVRL